MRDALTIYVPALVPSVNAEVVTPLELVVPDNDPNVWPVAPTGYPVIAQLIPTPEIGLL